MKYLIILGVLLGVNIISVAQSTCLNNPSIQAGDIDPAPLSPGGSGVLSLTYNHGGQEYSDFATDPMEITICFANIAPAAGTASLGGTFDDRFDWSINSAGCLVGIQNQTFVNNDGGTITVDFVQTNPIACPANQMGFIANIQPPQCMNATDLKGDNEERSFTCVSPDALPGLSVGDITINENDGTATVEVCLSATSADDVSFSYNTSDGTANSTSDYGQVSTTASIPAGQSCTNLTFNITDDSTPESTENFLVNLSSPTNATISDNQGVVTILDDDVAPVVPNITVSNVTVTEGGTAQVEVCLDQTTTQNVTVSFATSDGSAGSGDYNSISSQTVTIPAGQTCATVNVATIDDTDVESTETVNVTISNATGGTITDPDGIITILDNDDAPVVPNITIADVTVTEGGTAVVDICLSETTTQAVSVVVGTTNGTAISGSDYTAVNQTITIPAGSDCATVSIPTIDDSNTESSEQFNVVLSNANNGLISDPLGLVTILDNEAPCTVQAPMVIIGNN